MINERGKYIVASDRNTAIVIPVRRYKEKFDDCRRLCMLSNSL